MAKARYRARRSVSRDGRAEKAFDAPRKTGGASSAAQAFPWLLHHKITIPDRVPGYVHRAELVDQAMPTRRPLTFQEANRLLNREIITTRPRLRLVRCVALTLAGRQHEARSRYCWENRRTSTSHASGTTSSASRSSANRSN